MRQRPRTAGEMFAQPHWWPERDLLFFSPGIDLDVMVEGYRAGVFAMPIDPESFDDDAAVPNDSPIGWWSPLRRGVLPLTELKVSRSLRKSAKHYQVTIDTDFDAVVRACANPDRTGAWINSRMRELYLELHHRGIAHSFETRTLAGELVGGLYGISLGGLFAGESMFHLPQGRDASKVALIGLVDHLESTYDDTSQTLIDVQWLTDHLATLGAIEIDRDEYLARLPALLAAPNPWP